MVSFDFWPQFVFIFIINWHTHRPITLSESLSRISVSWLNDAIYAEKPNPHRLTGAVRLIQRNIGVAVGWMYHSPVALGLLWLLGSGIGIWIELRQNKRQE
jgi:hypothetical protein